MTRLPGSGGGGGGQPDGKAAAWGPVRPGHESSRYSPGKRDACHRRLSGRFSLPAGERRWVGPRQASCGGAGPLSAPGSKEARLPARGRRRSHRGAVPESGHAPLPLWGGSPGPAVQPHRLTFPASSPENGDRALLLEAVWGMGHPRPGLQRLFWGRVTSGDGWRLFRQHERIVGTGP